MLQALAKPTFTPAPIVRTGMRTSSRAARVATFALETWSRLLVDGALACRHERARELSWVAENLCALHGVRSIVHGAPPREPCVLVANHISYFDPLVIACHAQLTAIAKREVQSWPVVGELCKKLGVLYVDRDDAQCGARVLREAMTALEKGISVLVFPEGTTTRGDRVLPCKRGIFGAALHGGWPIVPVALRYERSDAPWVGDDLFLPHYLRTMTHACTRVSVEFLSPLAQRNRTAEQLAEQAQHVLHGAVSGGQRSFSLSRIDTDVCLASA